MEIMMATSRSINKDRFYQSQQDKRREIHLQKIKNISQMPPEPILIDVTFEKNLKRAKSAAKLFELQKNNLIRRIQNKSLLSKIINVQPTIKNIRMTKNLSKQKFVGSTNWATQKKLTEKIQKEHQIFLKRCGSLSTVNVKDVKKKLQQEIKQYLALKNSIRKIKSSATDLNKKKRNISSKKIFQQLPSLEKNAERSKIQQSKHLDLHQRESQIKLATGTKLENQNIV